MFIEIVSNKNTNNIYPILYHSSMFKIIVDKIINSININPSTKKYFFLLFKEKIYKILFKNIMNNATDKKYISSFIL